MRCVWPSGAENCNACYARGIKCIDQRSNDARVLSPRTYKTLRQRISELEGTIDQIIGQIEEKGSSKQLDQSEINTTELLRNLRLELQPSVAGGIFENPDTEPSTIGSPSNAGRFTGLDNAPLLSLFDNAVLCREEDCSEEVQFKSLSANYRYEERNAKILKSLRALTPSPQAVAQILQESRLSLCLLEKNFPEFPGLASYCLDSTQVGLLRDHLIQSLQSDNTVAVIKSALCLALCIQQLPPNFNLGSTSLPAPLEVLQNCYMETVEAFLSPEDGIAATIDGVECLLSQIRYYINAGLPRKAWVIFRRTLTFVQLLGGLQRKPEQHNRQRSFWFQMWQVDRSLSLLLGLPYAVCHFPYRIGKSTGVGPMLPAKARFMFQLGSLAGQIIDRNQDPENIDFQDTMRMDHELQESSFNMPISWWDALPGPETPVEVTYETLIAKFWYYNLRNLLHLPFVLKAFDDSQYQYSATAALESSRAMIQCYSILRDEKRPILRTCNMIDFQVFTSGMILILCLLSGLVDHDPSQQGKDWEMVDSLIQILNRLSLDMPDSVATQAGQLLDTLYRFRSQMPESTETFHAVVPYFGMLSIRRRETFVVKPESLSDTNENEPWQTAPGWEETMDVSGPDINFHSYFPFGDSQFWPDQATNWSSMVDSGLQDDWTWDFNDTDNYR